MARPRRHVRKYSPSTHAPRGPGSGSCPPCQSCSAREAYPGDEMSRARDRRERTPLRRQRIMGIAHSVPRRCSIQLLSGGHVDTAPGCKPVDGEPRPGPSSSRSTSSKDSSLRWSCCMGAPTVRHVREPRRLGVVIKSSGRRSTAVNRRGPRAGGQVLDQLSGEHASKRVAKSIVLAAPPPSARPGMSAPSCAVRSRLRPPRS